MNHAAPTADFCAAEDRAPRWAVLYWLALVLLALPPETYPAQQSFGSFRFLDYSYRLGLVDSLRHDQWAGRDLIFNYGPLFQALHGLGLWLPSGDAASIARFDGALESVLVLAMCWGVARRAGVTWRVTACFFAAWAVIVGSPGEFHGLHLKPMGGLWPLAVGAASWTAARGSGGWSRWLGRAVWMLAPLALLAYSFEMGPLLLAAQAAAAVLAWGASLGITTAPARELRRGAATAIALLLLTAGIVVVVAIASATFRAYLVDSWALTTSYAASWAAGGGALELGLLAVPPLAGAMALCWCVPALRRALREDQQVAAASALVVQVSIPYAVALVRYGLTRSDIFHVWRALAPTTFVAAVVAPCCLWRAAAARSTAALADQRAQGAASVVPGRLRKFAALSSVVAIAPWLFTDSTMPLWVLRANQMAQASLAPARAEVVDSALEKAVALAKNAPGDSLSVWPYGAAINVLANKRNPNPIVHTIEAHNPQLADRILAQMARQPDGPILVYPLAIDPDGVLNLSRTDPRIVQQMLEGYELAPGGEPGPVLLAPRNDRLSPWRWEPVSDGVGSFTPGDRRGVQVGLRPGACRLSDLLLLEIRATPIRTLGLFKPGRLVVILVLEDGTEIVRLMPLAVGDETRPIVVAAFENRTPWLPALFTRVPQSVVATEFVARVQLVWIPLDALSVAPSEIRLERVQVLKPGNDPGPPKFAANRDQWVQPRVWREIFAPSE